MSLTQRELKYLRSLRQKKCRLIEGRCLVEGARLVAEALQSPVAVERVLMTTSFTGSVSCGTVESALSAGELEPTVITDVQAQQLAETRHPQGIFAVVLLPSGLPPAKRLLQPPILILDDIADPGNLGTLLRTADWYGLPTVWVSRASADVYNPKVLRGGMGAHFHLPTLWQGDLTSAADELKSKDITLLGAALDGSPMEQLKPPSKNWALVIGSEARGLSACWRQRLDEVVTIPGYGQAESLNAAVAGGIILQRLLGSGKL